MPEPTAAPPTPDKKPARGPKITKSTKPETAAPASPSTASATPKPAKPAAQTPVSTKPAAPAAPAATVVDASDLILGRACSHIAKRLLNGESIVVVNAEKAVVTGGRKMVIDFYIANRARGSKRTGPHFPRYPDRIFRRTVRGMLPHLKTRGKDALERLEVYMGVPDAYASAPRQSIDNAKARPALRPPTTLEEVSRLLGARV
ncbi:MAG: 50S ribosomal protein L13 [Thermoplasmata archaeon]|nr:50S ribosomal protein L13 [Thermoplasmata archaeon]